MNYSVKEIRSSENSRSEERNAGGKARADVCSILSQIGFGEITVSVDESRGKASRISKMYKHIGIYNKWLLACEEVLSGDSIVIQYPIIDHSLLMGRFCKKLKRKGVKVIILVHDLFMLRTSNDTETRIRNRRVMEEFTLLKSADVVIVHNEFMKKYLVENGITGNKLICLQMFDYLVKDWDDDKANRRDIFKDEPVIIAGNLLKEKSGYVYDLPNNCMYNLYGINYTGKCKENIAYMGSFEPDELPLELNGSFGLVWDGPDISTCSGVYGNYLQYNNPHKLSLYLASEIPVIIWKHAALASFVLDNNLGLAVESIDEIPHVISELSNEMYIDIISNVKRIAPILRSGEFTNRAIKVALADTL